LVSVAAAAVVATMLHTSAGAQAPQTPPQPPPQGAPQTPPQTPPATPPRATAPTTQPDQVTLVGCIQKESEYRQAQDKGKGGAGTGIGTGDEFVLTNASMATQGLKSETAVPATAFELTGANEEKVKEFVGKRVQITGKLKAAEMGAAGRPTGGATAGAPPSGVDAASKDLKLRELEVISVSAASGTCTP
jgi:hypothetical protein